MAPAKERAHFAKPGDSGSVVVDDLGRIGGLVTGGITTAAQSMPDGIPDLVYATPIEFLIKRLEELGLTHDVRAALNN